MTSSRLLKNFDFSKVKKNDFNLDIRISKIKDVETRLSKTYDIKKYLDSSKFTFPPDMDELIPKDTPFFVDNGENYVERIARALSFFKQCALVGPSGTGKTHIVYMVAELARLPLWEINCGLQTSVFDLFGRYIGLGKENWIDGLIVNWLRSGGILYLDEANMMKQDIATRLNPVLDARGHMVLTEKDNELIPRHKDSYLIVSMNPVSSEFAGTKPLNAAMRRRLSVWLNFDYMSVGNQIDEKEVNLVYESCDIDKDIARKMVQIASKLREEYKAGDLPYAPSVGDLINWGLLIADGSTLEESSDETIIHMTSDEPEVQDEVRKIVYKFLGSGNEN